MRKKHGQVEDRKRIDSFDCDLRAFQIGLGCLPFDRCDDTIKVCGTTIHLEYVHNAACRLTFFICPRCGSRVRFLYLPGLRCRKCERLNYRIQQTAHGSRDALLSIPQKLGVALPLDDVTELVLGGYTLERPRYMRKARFDRIQGRYQKHLTAFLRREIPRLIYYFNYGLEAMDDSGGGEE